MFIFPCLHNLATQQEAGQVTLTPVAFENPLARKTQCTHIGRETVRAKASPTWSGPEGSSHNEFTFGSHRLTVSLKI